MLEYIKNDTQKSFFLVLCQLVSFFLLGFICASISSSFGHVYPKINVLLLQSMHVGILRLFFPLFFTSILFFLNTLFLWYNIIAKCMYYRLDFSFMYFDLDL